MKIKEETSKETVSAAGGQHRSRALSMWLDIMEKRANKVQDKMEDIAGSKYNDADDADGEIEEYNKLLKPQLEQIRRQMAYGGQWMVQLFDSGTFSHYCLFARGTQKPRNFDVDEVA